MTDKYLDYIKNEPVEQQRYLTLKSTLSGISEIIAGKRILDFGASYALTTCALLESGAKQVIGVEPDRQRVERGNVILEDIGYASLASIRHVEDTTKLPFADADFDIVIANAVLEHIPPPRTPYIRDMWRVLSKNGYLIVNETPNKYFPIDKHTTGLWFVPWLPSLAARRYAIFRNRFSRNQDWNTSGWRGISYYEIVKGLDSAYKYLPEEERIRHKILSFVGLPSSLIDPYPLFIFEKM